MMAAEKPFLAPCEGINKPLDLASIEKFLTRLGDGWTLTAEKNAITKDFCFKNYYQTIAFVNAIAWLTHFENHHPDLEVGYNHCRVRYTTHAIHGLSENDFMCANKINRLYHSH